jgi:hypothetical protein
MAHPALALVVVLLAGAAPAHHAPRFPVRQMPAERVDSDADSGTGNCYILASGAGPFCVFHYNGSHAPPPF